ncbi:MAG: DUF1467 family protein [Rhizobiaceae bacterium]
MDLITGVAVYFIIWWVTLFITLPFRMQSQIEAGVVVEGTEAGAPADPKIQKRLLWNTLISLLLFFIFWLIFYYFEFSIDDLPQIIKIRKL